MKLTVLGFLGGYPAHGNGTSSYLLQSAGFNLLIDCGSAALLSLEETLDPLKLNAVILTHYHHDHTADLGVLQYYWQLHAQRYAEHILPIYGHNEDQQNFSGLDWPGATTGIAYDPNQTLVLGPFKIGFLKTHHPVPAYALKIVDIKSNKVLVFTADTAYFDQLTPFSARANLLMTDTNFFANKTGQRWHMTSTESGKLAKDAQVDQLLLTHLPAEGNLSQLKDEAQITAGDIPIIVASRHLEVTI
ncbi:MBL fold metallo-hydrolase [Lentilactobacillus kisonensis]|uniref:Metallo-beta-lactamase domain protein n=1 Tax=Lentilactobacillus kisonensis F0435 TaxID=797516 RepID=H1LKI5_9LACO|nr:MBL fold metallo-hydrolase [Lentilactobacillus kisonensis]EHO46871.1 metallo-beta-lactamase domain protein [Lentilactobacillus kisonensis F0435]